MHFLKNLVNFMLPIVPVILNSDTNDLPIGFGRVITSRGGFVITDDNSFVIAKN